MKTRGGKLRLIVLERFSRWCSMENSDDVEVKVARHKEEENRKQEAAIYSEDNPLHNNVRGE